MKNKIKYLTILFACIVLFLGVLSSYSQQQEQPMAISSGAIQPTGTSLEITEGVRVVEKSMALQSLIIAEGASLAAPEGKYLTMTHYGLGKQIKPGTYKGDVFISVTDNYLMDSGSRFGGTPMNLHMAILIDDGKVVPEKCTPAVVYGGKVTDTTTDGIYIASEEDAFNGIVIDGDTEYTINNVKIDLDGCGANDFVGVGSAVAAYGNARVTINDSEFTNVNGVVRCAVHVGGNSLVTVNNCKISNYSLPDPVRKGVDVDWQVDFSGTNRLTQLTENGTVYYNNCHFKGNGWSLCSIDGGQDATMYVKDSTLELSGTRSHGYGAFCHGGGEIEVTFDHCTIDVTGYPIAVMSKEERANIINGCLIKGRRFGAFVFGDDNSVVTIKDSTFQTDKSTLCIKGSATTINIDNTAMNAKNGVIVQLMDSDEYSGCIEYKIPVGVVDVALPGRDLATASPTEDVHINIANSDIHGNFFNSSTNIRAYKNSVMGRTGTIGGVSMGGPDPGAAPEDAGPPEDMEGMEMMMGGIAKDLRGPKNLSLNFTNVKVEGIISSATQAYREGLTSIVPESKRDLSNVTQTAAEPVNNGVIVSFDKDCIWTVAGTSYLTKLTIAKGAAIKASGGKTLTMTVDGVETPIKAGTYKGKIMLTVTGS